MNLLTNAELFAKTKHGGKQNEIGVPYSNHLENVVNRLKSLGVIDEEVICAAWLQEILEHTDTSFDELFEKFGRRISTLILSLTETKLVIDTNDNSTLSLTKKRTISKKQRQKEYGIRDKDKKIVSGDPEKIKKIYDTWIFSRDTTSANPNWQLVNILT